MSRKIPPGHPLSLFLDLERADDAHHGIEPVFTADEVLIRVEELAAALARWFDDDTPVAQVVMNGAMMFAADLSRALSSRGLVLEMDFLTIEKDRRAGTRRLVTASDRPVHSRDVLVIDDIYETGRTLSLAREHFLGLGAASVTFVALLDKSGGQQREDRPDFIGFDCPDVFVIGYGMDVAYRYRELPFIGKMGRA